MEDKILYPCLPTAPADPVTGPSAFRLNRILEIQTLLLNEERSRISIAKKYRRAACAIDCINTTLAAGSVASGVGSVTALSTVIGAPVAVGLSAVAATGGLLCMVGRVIGRRLESIVKKHDRIAISARTKKNSIDVIISEAIRDDKISDAEFKIVIDEWDRYQILRDSIREKSKTSSPISNEDVKKLVLRGREEERKELLNRLG